MIPGGILRAFLAATVAAALTACFEGGGTGSGTETESAFGVVRNQNGSPAVAARVTLRPFDYLTDTSVILEENLQLRDTVTDANGHFGFDSLPAGIYRLEFRDNAGMGSSREFTVDERDHLELTDETLAPLGSIAGTALLDSASRQQKVYVQVFGLERLIAADSATGKFNLPDMPRGTYKLRFLSPQPVFMSASQEGVGVEAGRATTISAPVLLQGDPKFTFSIKAGALEIAGIDPSSPVLFDNERWDNGIDNEYVWSRASAGVINLKGNIVTNDGRKGDTSSVDEQMAKCLAELRLANLGGIRGIPPPVAGSRFLLTQPSGIPIEHMAAERSDGSDLIVAEAEKASVEHPLIVVVGGPPTTVANAYLTKPSIAPKMIVMCVFSFGVNGADNLATYIVSKRCRCIHWGRIYFWQGKLDMANLSLLPKSWMGQRMAGFLLSPSNKDKRPLGDIAPIAYMLRHSLWTSAAQARIVPPIAVTPASNFAFDFLDIPQDANDFPGIEKDFFAAMAEPASYRPQAVPGSLQAESYIDVSGAKLSAVDGAAKIDTAYGYDAVSFNQDNWCDYSVTATAASYNAVFRYRSPQGAKFNIGPAGTPLATVDLPTSSGWTDARASFAVSVEGPAKWRVTAIKGSFDLDSISLAIP
jgi:hypothetical protein